jgi:hypothetical protein
MSVKEKKAPSYKLDIFSVLSKLNSGDLHIWEKLSEEERKGFSAYIITRWMSGTSDEYQIMCLNELVNPHVFSAVGKNPEIMAKLLACCGTKSSKRFSWIGESKRSGKESSMALDVVKEYFDYTSREAKSQLSLLENCDIIEMAEELGWQTEDLKKLKKDLS